MSDVAALAAAAAAIGFGHTLLGPDHYVPFIALARSQRWSLARAVVVTLQCGLGHVSASIGLGLVGVAGGFAVSRLDAVESQRAAWASWALVALGVAYTAWGLRHAYRHRHPHHHGLAEAVGGQAAAGKRPRASAWALFIVFVLGPCEPLVPLLMVPAATGRPAATVAVAAAFVVATLATMTSVVALGVLGVGRLELAGVERFAHALAGATILLCGVGIRWLGW